MRTIASFAIVATLLGIIGCAEHTQPVGPQPQLTSAQRNFQAVWTASQDVLRRCNFTISQKDARSGLITTEPLLGKYFFEFWRKDAANRCETIESTVQPIYRSVEVTIKKTAPDQFTPIVRVNVSRKADDSLYQAHSTSEALSKMVVPGQKNLRKQIESDRPAYQTGETGNNLGESKALAEKITKMILEETQKNLAEMG